MKYIVYKQNLINTLKGFNSNAYIYYPIKANSNDKLIRLIDKYIQGYEVESLFHARYLIGKINVFPNRILYSFQTSPAKDANALMKLGITHYVVDDIERCKTLIYAAKKRQMKLKFFIRMDVSETIQSSILTKWGASLDDVAFMKKYIPQEGHAVSGISYYLPKEICNLDNSKKMMKYIYKNVGLKDNQILDVGGGVTYEELKQIRKYANKLFKNNICLIVEPGRTLLNPNIDMLVKVNEIREKKNLKMVFIDSGIYSGLLDHMIKGREFIIESLRKDTILESCVVCGNTSDISDNVGCYMLPRDICVGDELLIKGCGSYCGELITGFCNKIKTIYEIVE